MNSGPCCRFRRSSLPPVTYSGRARIVQIGDQRQLWDVKRERILGISHARMKQFEEPTGLADEVAVADGIVVSNGHAAPCVGWKHMRKSEHFVQFYESDDFLVESVGAFMGGGLGAGEGAIVIATPAHRAAIEKRLRAQGIDFDAVQLRGQYVALDAADTLSRLMVRGMPDESLFMNVVGSLIEKTRSEEHTSELQSRFGISYAV